MIRAAVELLVSQLNDYVRSNGQDDPVVSGNIAYIDPENLSRKVDVDRIVVSLVNLQEENTLKNGAAVRTVGANTFYENRPVFLNLYLLFSAHFTEYPPGLDALADVIEFFQGNKVFSYRHSPPTTGLPTDPDTREIQIHLDLHTLNFQEINDLWGSLGGKQVPFVMYKARLLPLKARVPATPTHPITEIEIDAGGRS